MIVVGWGNTRHEYIICRFERGWNIGEFRHAVGKLLDLAASGNNAPVLIDLRMVENRDLLNLMYEYRQHEKVIANRIVFVGQFYLSQSAYDLISGFFRDTSVGVSLVDTMDEAYSLVMENKWAAMS